MASNRTRIRGRQLALVPTDGGVAAGDPCLVGNLPGVSMNGKSNAGNTTPQTIDTLGVYSLSVKGVRTGPANHNIVSGDLIYYNSGHTPKLDADTGGILFGIALGVPTAAGGDSGYPSGECVASGATTTIDVRLGGAS